MLRASAFAASALVVASLAAAIPAEAARKRPNEVTVRGRSYFDAGTIVRAGSGGQTNYILVGTTFQTPAPFDANRGFAGGETLPGRFYLPNCCGVTVNTPNFYSR